MKRALNIECFRIVATIFVIILHVLGQGGILESSVEGGSTYWAAWFLEIMAYCSVNCFALITGYVMVDKNVFAKNIINLWLKVIFYSLIISSVIFVLIPDSIGLKRIVTSILPITGMQWWYISSYFSLFLTIPFLNAGISCISQKYYRKLLIVILIGVCTISCLLPIDAFTLNNGYSMLWLNVVYLFGAYIRKYDLHKKITAKKSLLCFAVMVILTFVSKLVIFYLTSNVFGKVVYDEKLISYTSITILLSAIFLFLFFLNIKIDPSEKWSKVLRFFFSASLGTYLIHTHPLVFDFVLKDMFKFIALKNPFVMGLSVLIVSFAIFAICAVIDALVNYLFKIAKVEKIGILIENTANSIYSKIFNKT